MEEKLLELLKYVYSEGRLDALTDDGTWTDAEVDHYLKCEVKKFLNQCDSSVKDGSGLVPQG